PHSSQVSSTWLFLFSPPFPPPDLLSFPTRRSSDLTCAIPMVRRFCSAANPSWTRSRRRRARTPSSSGCVISPIRATGTRRGPCRSEEHTSELQSHLNLVCRLLLEKKNTKRKTSTYS